MAENGLFFDERELLRLGISLPTVEAIKRLLDSSVNNNTTGVAQNSQDIATNTANISTNTANISTNTTDITTLESDKADKRIPATTSNIAILDSTGNLADGGTLIADLMTLSNAGSPEGVVTSNRTRLCVDTVGSQMYFNPSIGASTGWVAV